MHKSDSDSGGICVFCSGSLSSFENHMKKAILSTSLTAADAVANGMG